MVSKDIKKVIQATVNAKDAAKYIGVSYWMILEMVKRNEIPCIKCGVRKLFRIATLDKWMEQQELQNSEPIKESEDNQYGTLRKIY